VDGTAVSERGELSVEFPPGGARFVVRLPISPGESPPPAPGIEKLVGSSTGG
jgi:hypothetical protein